MPIFRGGVFGGGATGVCDGKEGEGEQEGDSGERMCVWDFDVHSVHLRVLLRILFFVENVLFFVVSSVFDDSDFFERNEPVGYHFVDVGEEVVYFFLAVDDFDDDGQVFGKAEDFAGVESAVLAETHGATQDGGACEVLFACFHDDGFVKGLTFPVITFADEDSEEDSGFGDIHR